MERSDNSGAWSQRKLYKVVNGKVVPNLGLALPFTEQQAHAFATAIVNDPYFKGNRQDIDIKLKNDYWNANSYLQIKLGNPGPVLVVQCKADWVLYCGQLDEFAKEYAKTIVMDALKEVQEGYLNG